MPLRSTGDAAMIGGGENRRAAGGGAAAGCAAGGPNRVGGGRWMRVLMPAASVGRPDSISA